MDKLPYQIALDAWNDFRMRTEPGELTSNIERLIDYQQLVAVADKTFPAPIAKKERKKLLQEHSGLIMQDEKLRNKYYELKAEWQRAEDKKMKKVQKPKHWEEKFIPNSKDEYE